MDEMNTNCRRLGLFIEMKLLSPYGKFMLIVIFYFILFFSLFRLVVLDI